MLELHGTYASVQEAAQMLGVTERYIRKMLVGGRIQGAVKTGRDWLIPVVNGAIAVESNQVQVKDER